MDTFINNHISTIWNHLEDEAAGAQGALKRKYKRLELGQETGIRLSYYIPDNTIELLIEVGTDSDTLNMVFPDWKGMLFDVIKLDTPVPDSYHICLRLQYQQYREVFLSVCSDLASELQNVSSAIERKNELVDFLNRWSRFFERHGMQGLSKERQRGLYGELWWLRCLIEKGMNTNTAAHSWKGYERGYHDFDMNGRILEVKTTISKEPRKVTINSERQLDDRGLVSLHLLALSLIQVDNGGESLPEMVNYHRKKLNTDAASANKFEYCLRGSGYLDNHSDLYDLSYIVKNKDLFMVEQGFPRIIEVPPGLGDIKYSLLISACAPYLAEIEDYIDALLEAAT